MANLDELETLAEKEAEEVAARARRFREIRERRMLPPAQESQQQVISLTDILRGVPVDSDIDRAAAALDREADEAAGQERLATITGMVEMPEEDKEPVLVAKPQPVVDTDFKVSRGRVYVYDRLPDGTTVQRDVTANYRRGSHGRLPEDASKQDHWNRLPPIMQPIVMRQDTPFPCSRTVQTKHDAHCGAVCD